MTARRWMMIGMAAVLIAGCRETPAREDAPAPAETPVAAAARPDPGKCPPPPTPYDAEEFGARPEPLAVPESIGAIAVTDGDNLAVSTLAGGQVCHDVSWILGFPGEASTHGDGRFVAIGYGGYEAFGTLVFDRAGEGMVVDTGNPPVFSPSGRLMAGLQLSESSYGGLEGFAIWRVEPRGLTEVLGAPEQETVFGGAQGFTAFEIDGWRGEDCIDLHGSALEDRTDAETADKAPRMPFFAARNRGWRIARGTCPA